MTDQDLESLLSFGHETNGVEFKGPGSRTDKSFLTKVVRAVIGMANRRDGGTVILGVPDKPSDPIGLDEDQAATWDFDNLAESVNTYASPSVSFDLERKLYRGHTLVVIRVHEFAEIPILCKTEYSTTLRRGACYVRSRHKPETAEIRSEEEMRELLELAIDKGLKKFIARAAKVGMFPTGPFPSEAPDDEGRFRKQIEDME